MHSTLSGAHAWCSKQKTRLNQSTLLEEQILMSQGDITDSINKGKYRTRDLDGPSEDSVGSDGRLDIE